MYREADVKLNTFYIWHYFYIDWLSSRSGHRTPKRVAGTHWTEDEWLQSRSDSGGRKTPLSLQGRERISVVG
jgi:hypothetical protein